MVRKLIRRGVTLATLTAFFFPIFLTATETTNADSRSAGRHHRYSSLPSRLLATEALNMKSLESDVEENCGETGDSGNSISIDG